ncbi:MAG: GNAT family N-acetyltransferase [Oscillospiraceae bacterium]|nr:GNAT family N-acetyltransferase [Oscillospiraceae bacterium]
MNIDFLYNCPQLAPQVTALLEQAFGMALGERFYGELTAHSMTPGQLPLTIAAWEGEALLGTVGLWRTDLLPRQDLTPWLACLAVQEAHRRRGIGTALQNFLARAARDMGFETVYLYTTLVDYYEKTGWVHFDGGYELIDGSAQKIYRLDL